MLFILGFITGIAGKPLSGRVVALIFIFLFFFVMGVGGVSRRRGGAAGFIGGVIGGWFSHGGAEARRGVCFWGAVVNRKA